MTSEDTTMGIFDDALAGLATAGRARRRRARPEPVPVRATPWLTVGAVATVALVTILAAAMAALGYGAWVMATDDLLLGLAMIVAPVALAGLGMGLSAIGWMVGVTRRLLNRDGRARLELGVLGLCGSMVGAAMVWVAFVVPGLVVLLPSVTALAVAVVPRAWQPRPPVDWARWDGDGTGS
ncbi:MAG TPA: hypothetical protein VFO65_06010 [Acidimicrobiales bacterium]|nr:hypothetical protein [Acidimicrobiales bacterium]